jgi:CspA family cold shock protein
MARGSVKFFRPDKGWGAVSCDELPPGRDAWFHVAHLQGGRLPPLEAGDPVDFEYERVKQDSFDYRATWVRRSPSL